MHLAKGGKFMVILNAAIVDIEGERYLLLKTPKEDLKIPITKDRPKDIQDVFNKLIVFLKKGLFQFELEVSGEGDIIYHVVKEYLSHLNSELENVFGEMKGCDLLESHTPEQ